ncbi:hypothetical protein V495_08079, partial [Pseudogymnoascus sp. VKM F-4514 (FW-929)]
QYNYSQPYCMNGGPSESCVRCRFDPKIEYRRVDCEWTERIWVIICHSTYWYMWTCAVFYNTYTCMHSTPRPFMQPSNSFAEKHY